MPSENDWKREYQELKTKYDRDSGTRLLKSSFLTWGLQSHIDSYLRKATIENPLPENETSRVAAAIINRTLIGTFLGILISVSTIALLYNQARILSKQVDLLGRQDQVARVGYLQERFHYLLNMEREYQQRLDSVLCNKKGSDELIQFSEVENAIYINRKILRAKDMIPGMISLMGPLKARESFETETAKDIEKIYEDYDCDINQDSAYRSVYGLVTTLHEMDGVKDKLIPSFLDLIEHID